MRKQVIVSMLVLISSVLTMSAQQIVEGEYVGKFTRIYMNKEKSVPAESFTTTVLQLGSLISLKMEPFQIGKMPGTIEIDAKNIVLNPDGSFNQTVYNGIKLTLFSREKSYNAIVSGRIVNKVLTYTITSQDATYLGVPFTAIAGFQGVKQ